jgi:oxygen-independent coproporphyrinogen-3 oxidase
MPAYEISNHAAPGAESRHNRVYWRYGDYVGIGPGAHGRLTLGDQRIATEQWRMPGKWLKAAEHGNADELRTPLTRQDQANEFLMMGMCLLEGIDTQRFTHLAGHPLPKDKLRYLSDIGMVEFGPEYLRTTAQGRIILNAILKDLMVD